MNQAEIDVCKGNLLVKCYEWSKENAGLDPPEDVVNTFYEEIRCTDMSHLQKKLQSALTSQMETIFQNIHKATLELNDNPPANEEYEEELAHRLIQLNGFVLDIKKSMIPNAGYGVFLKGTYVSAGTVMVLFPGLVHLAQYLTNDYVDSTLLPDPEYFLMARMDGSIIDGRSARKTPYNPYGFGHMVNHPPRHTDPNVLQLTYDFPGDPFGIEEFPKHLQKYIPNLYARKPTLLGTPDRSACMRSVVLVASKTIRPGEELFMDYRLNPDVDEPSWYVQVDEDLSRKRWERPYY